MWIIPKHTTQIQVLHLVLLLNLDQLFYPGLFIFRNTLCFLQSYINTASIQRTKAIFFLSIQSNNINNQHKRYTTTNWDTLHRHIVTLEKEVYTTVKETDIMVRKTKEERETWFAAIPYGALECMCETQIFSNGNIDI